MQDDERNTITSAIRNTAKGLQAARRPFAVFRENASDDLPVPTGTMRDEYAVEMGVWGMPQVFPFPWVGCEG